MDYSRLEKGIMDFIQEEQVKLGYRKEKIRLYYPLSSLKHFLGEEVSGKSTEELEKEFEFGLKVLSVFAGSLSSTIRIS